MEDKERDAESGEKMSRACQKVMNLFDLENLKEREGITVMVMLLSSMIKTNDNPQKALDNIILALETVHKLDQLEKKHEA